VLLVGNVSRHAHHTWENFPHTLYMVNMAAFTTSVYTTGAHFSCMSWEHYRVSFPVFVRELISH